mgnify:CR=1 FL=1
MTRQLYAIRELSIPEGEWHECVSSIVAVLQSSYNSQRRVWYLTALIQRNPLDTERFGTEEGHGVPEEDA